MSTNYVWSKDAIDVNTGGSTLYDWLESSRNGSNRTLIVCGAGISVTGPSPAPLGWHVGNAYENYLRAQGKQIPLDVCGDIAKLYEHFCYEKDSSGGLSFSLQNHNQFIKSITNKQNNFYFSGKPNFQHDAIVNEVLQSNGNLRVYSLNLDEFFDNSLLISPGYQEENVVNASDLINMHQSSVLFRKWRILAAHGRNTMNSRSVWSHNILSDSGNLNVQPHLNGEKDILVKALECIKQGPYYDQVIFVGLAAPLNYLMKTLTTKLSNDIKWLWINPYDSPKEWLFENDNSLITEENGEWIKASLTECLWVSHSLFYERWFNNSCGLNSEEIPLFQRYDTLKRKQNLVESLFRARRIFEKGVDAWNNQIENKELIEGYDSQNNIYPYPDMISGNKYSDNLLGMTLHSFYKERVQLNRRFTDRFPSLTVAGKSSDYSPVSTHIFKVHKHISIDKVSIGIAETFDAVFLDPDHRHIIVLDTEFKDQIPILIRAIDEELKNRFSRDYIYVDVVKAEDLQIYLDQNNLHEPPLRGVRP